MFFFLINFGNFPPFLEKQSSAETEASRNLLDSVGDSLSNQNSESSDPTLIDHFFKNENSNHEHENDQLKAENSDNELDSEPKDESDDENDLENSKDKNSSIQQKPCRKVSKPFDFDLNLTLTLPPPRKKIVVAFY